MRMCVMDRNRSSSGYVKPAVPATTAHEKELVPSAALCSGTQKKKRHEAGDKRGGYSSCLLFTY